MNINKYLEESKRKYKDDKYIMQIIELIEQSIDIDSPESVGKSLSLKKLKIIGLKNDNSKIDFEMEFNKGINIIVASNLKGKSSVFKVIKFALTGNDSIKEDVKDWIKEIVLEFKINNKSFVILLKQTTRLSAKLYHGSLSEIEAEGFNDKPLIDTVGIQKYKQEIQKFFFKQFSYYPLKYTKKIWDKTKTGLITVDLSWAGYYKSIYLESKDSVDFYGNQTKKRFEMLLGLDYTYIINKLTVDMELVQSNLALHTAQNERSFKDTSSDYKSRLEDEKVRLMQQVTEIGDLKSDEKRLDRLLNDQLDILKHINNSTDEQIRKNTETSLINEQIKSLEVVNNDIASEIKRIEKERNKLLKYKNRLSEYIEGKAFFSNLDIKVCPSCNKEVEVIEDKGECSLCHNEKIQIDEGYQLEYEAKLEQLDNTVIVYQDEVNKLKVELGNNDMSIAALKKRMNEIEDTSNGNIDLFVNQHTDIRKEIEIVEERLRISTDEIIKIKEKIAVIEYKLNRVQIEDEEDTPVYEQQIFFYKEAIKVLEENRLESSKSIIKNLEEIIYKELIDIGLTSIEKVKIDNNLSIKYQQNNKWVGFSDISEGEQLRAKLAFHLGLIRLDIDKNFGRHTRFLVIDSPNKEEADAKYVLGLSNQLKDLEKKYGDDLQIIIGTASREYENLVKNEYVYPEGEYVF